jgi:hypothetical protein
MRNSDMDNELAVINTTGGLLLNMHAGQQRAWDSARRFVLMLAGTQSGKTSFGPHWLLREIQRCGQGDYLVVTPTFPLLDLKALPAFLWLFETVLHLGRFTASPSRKFIFDPEGEQRLFGTQYDPDRSTRVIFGYATEPESLESATVKAAWLDEAGQKRFKLGSYEAIRRRLSLNRGRILVTTSLYGQNWVKTLYDRAKAGGVVSLERDQKGGEIRTTSNVAAGICVVQFDSTANSQFSREEFEEARAMLPRWKFNLQYRGQFERPAGLIYDCVTEATFEPRFTIPPDWRRYQGLDFGTQNMASVFAAEEPETKRLYVYREYHAGGVSTVGHVRQMRHGEPPTSANRSSEVGGELVGLPFAVGGAPSEDDWRSEFRKAGLPVRRPHIADVELGIDRVYGAFQSGKLRVFDDLVELREEIQTYSRKLNEREEPTAEIEDKDEYHLLDSLRYLVSEASGGPRNATSGRVEDIGLRSSPYPLAVQRRATVMPSVARTHVLTDEEIERMLDAALIEQSQAPP